MAMANAEANEENEVVRPKTNVNEERPSEVNANLETNQNLQVAEAIPAVVDEPKINYFHPPLQSANQNKVTCTCTKTNCKKKYCACYSKNRYCLDCDCKNCENIPPKDFLIQNNINNSIAVIQPSPVKKNSFLNICFFGNNQMAKNMQGNQPGCNCSHSNCKKKYCECFKVGKECSSNCRCRNCYNKPGYKNENNIPKDNLPPEKQKDKDEVEATNENANNSNPSSSQTFQNRNNSEKKDYHYFHKIYCPFDAEGLGVEVKDSDLIVTKRKVFLGYQKTLLAGLEKDAIFRKQHRKRNKIFKKEEPKKEIKADEKLKEVKLEEIKEEQGEEEDKEKINSEEKEVMEKEDIKEDSKEDKKEGSKAERKNEKKEKKKTSKKTEKREQKENEKGINMEIEDPEISKEEPPKAKGKFIIEEENSQTTPKFIGKKRGKPNHKTQSTNPISPKSILKENNGKNSSNQTPKLTDLQAKKLLFKE